MLFSSCGVYRLSKSDLEWQPYKVGDVLVFESTKGEVDTVLIEAIKSYMNADDPLALFPDYDQSLFISLKKNILCLTKNRFGSYMELSFFLKTKDRKSYPITFVTLSDEYISKLDTIVFNGYPVFKIEAKTKAYTLSHIDWDLQYFYWSKQYGYMAFEFKEGYKWYLKSFVRDGVKILEIE